MSPPLKRQRSSSDASPPANDDATAQMDVVAVDAQHEDQTIDVSEPQPHGTLWYEDGNVVLKTDEHLYRVHKSVLSRHSTVFKDMFHVAEDGEGETKDAIESKSVMYEGLPLVALDDSDEDVFNFLSTLYSRSFFRMHQRTTLSILISLSRMSTKYNASEIRSEVIAHLAQIYPDTLAKYEAQRWNTLFERPPHDLEFHLLALARRCNAHILLPPLFYTCASLPLYLILDSSAIVSQEDHRTILEGREKLMKFSYEVATLALLQGKKCRSAECATRRTNAIVGHIDYNTYDPPPFIFRASTDGVLPLDPAIRAYICSACVKNYQEALQALRDSLWVDLPSIFNLGKWSGLRRRMLESGA